MQGNNLSRENENKKNKEPLSMNKSLGSKRIQCRIHIDARLQKYLQILLFWHDLPKLCLWSLIMDLIFNSVKCWLKWSWKGTQMNDCLLCMGLCSITEDVYKGSMNRNSLYPSQN